VNDTIDTLHDPADRSEIGEIGLDRFFLGFGSAERANVGHSEQVVRISEPCAQRAADRAGCAGDEYAFVSSSHVASRPASARGRCAVHRDLSYRRASSVKQRAAK
jgi:hypothetical protein